MIGAYLVDVPYPVQVARHEQELVRLYNISREKSQWDHKEYSQPEVGRSEKIVVVAIHGCYKPARFDSRVNGLGNFRQSTGWSNKRISHTV